MQREDDFEQNHRPDDVKRNGLEIRPRHEAGQPIVQDVKRIVSGPELWEFPRIFHGAS
jgi:hypothetical protein